MDKPQELELTPTGAASLFLSELSLGEELLVEGKVDAALDGYIRALGLALQLGPAPTGQALTSILRAARHLAHRKSVAGLSALGPGLVGLINQMRESRAIPNTATMEAWALFVEDLGALVGEIGLALAMPTEHRSGMIANARSRAALLDDATAARFALAAWLDEVAQ